MLIKLKFLTNFASEFQNEFQSGFLSNFLTILCFYISFITIVRDFLQHFALILTQPSSYSLTAYTQEFTLFRFFRSHRTRTRHSNKKFEKKKKELKMEKGRRRLYLYAIKLRVRSVFRFMMTPLYFCLCNLITNRIKSHRFAKLYNLDWAVEFHNDCEYRNKVLN